jgi:hypothetical protein
VRLSRSDRKNNTLRLSETTATECEQEDTWAPWSAAKIDFLEGGVNVCGKNGGQKDADQNTRRSGFAAGFVTIMHPFLDKPVMPPVR